jgi:hypothetical protein
LKALSSSDFNEKKKKKDLLDDSRENNDDCLKALRKFVREISVMIADIQVEVLYSGYCTH